jgi:hypothetical protein
MKGARHSAFFISFSPRPLACRYRQAGIVVGRIAFSANLGCSTALGE